MSIKTVLDWHLLGQLYAHRNALENLIRDTYKDMGIGIGLLSWLLDENGGRPHLVERLKELGQKFRAATEEKPAERIRVRKKRHGRATLIEVNLDAPPMLPFEGAKVDSIVGTGTRTGWVEVERRGKNLYINKKKVVLYLSERQQNGQAIRGHELREELTGKPVLHPNILGALFEHPHLIPEVWKGKLVYFWAVIFSDRDGGLYVRYLYGDGASWSSGDRWLDGGWGGRGPAASLAS